MPHKAQQVLFICNSCNKKQYRMSTKHKGRVFEICRRCKPIERDPNNAPGTKKTDKKVIVKRPEPEKTK